MPIIKPSTAFKAGADWVSAEVRAYHTDQTPIHVDTVADVRDNDFERARWVYVWSKAVLYRLNLSSGADDDGDTVLRDNMGRRYVKVPGSADIEQIQSDIVDLNDRVEGAAEGLVQADTWASLTSINGTRGGQPGRVTGPDGGTHTDPVDSGTKANEGEYAWSESPAGWKWVKPGSTTKSEGAGDAGKTPALDGSGRLDFSFLPSSFRELEDEPLFAVSDSDNTVFSIEPDGQMRGPSIDEALRYARAAAPPPRVYIDGDSRSDLCSNAGRTTARGWLGWLQTLSRGRFECRNEWNFGVSGQRVEQMLARTHLWAGLPPATMICIISTNNLTASNSADGFLIPLLEHYQRRVLAAGHRLVWIAETPRGDTANPSYTLSANNHLNHMRMRQWFLDQANVRNVYVVDPWPVMADPLRTDGRALDTMLRDGIHTGAFGGYTIGRVAQPLIEKLFPSRDVLPATNGDLYHATHNATGALNPNPMQAGTGGTAGTGCSGDVANDWEAVAGPGLACVCSKQTINGKVWQRGVVTGGATAINTAVDAAGNKDYTSISAVFAADLDHTKIGSGDNLQAVCEVHVPAGATGLRGVSLWIEYTTAGGYYLTAAMEPDEIRSQINLNYPGDEWSGVLVTQPTGPIADMVTAARVYLAITGAEYSSSVAPISATVDFRAVKTRKIEDL